LVPATVTTTAICIALDVKAGDRVLFGKWSGTEVKLDGEDLLIMKESDIMGILEAEPADILNAICLNTMGQGPGEVKCLLRKLNSVATARERMLVASTRSPMPSR
jgi:hypothetical protein